MGVDQSMGDMAVPHWRGITRICSHLLKIKKFLMEKFIFFHWFVQVNRQKTTVKKKITYFFLNYVASLFAVFEKVLAICKFFFTARCLDVRFWDLLYFICLTFIVLLSCSIFSAHLFLRTPLDGCFCVFFFAERKCIDLVVIFNNGREETSAISL